MSLFDKLEYSGSRDCNYNCGSQTESSHRSQGIDTTPLNSATLCGSSTQQQDKVYLSGGIAECKRYTQLGLKKIGADLRLMQTFAHSCGGRGSQTHPLFLPRGLRVCCARRQYKLKPSLEERRAREGKKKKKVARARAARKLLCHHQQNVRELHDWDVRRAEHLRYASSAQEKTLLATASDDPNRPEKCTPCGRGRSTEKSQLRNDSIGRRIKPLQQGFEELVVPGFEELVVPGFKELVVPGFEELVVPGFEELVVPGFEELVVPGFKELVVPGFKELVVPGFEELVVPGGSQDGSSRFPKLEECAHFHYDIVDFGSLQVTLCEEDRENYRHNEVEPGERTVLVRVSCNNKSWNVRRTLSHFRSLDRQLHRCIFDRKFSQLPELHSANTDTKTTKELEYLLHTYLKRFSELAGSMINCGSILNWLEMDNRGNRLLAVDDSGINTPAIAAAHAIKRYNAQAADEISLQVGDIVSVIDMPPAEDTIWWRGKRGFEVGFFPYECVEVITDKVPPSVASCIPTASLSSSPGSTLTPSATPATARKPCEPTETVDDASMMRKHGKLMSFLRTFFSTRPPRNQLKQSGIVKERVFGCDLGEHLLNSGHDVPLVLKSCSEVIERHGIVDGIYRLSGITSNIQKLRVAFDEDQVPELMESTYLQDIHSISSLLKMYFRELPNPLLTYQLYDKFAEAVKDEDNKLLRIHDVVQQLPPPHYRTLEYLMRHLGRVASHAVETGMHSKNLAIVWAPNLLRSKELELGGGAAALQGVGIQAVVTECLICYCDIIFSDKMPSYGSPHLQKSQRKPRPKSLAISTPTSTPDSGGGARTSVYRQSGTQKKSNKDVNKGKKSPVTGWKSIFSKPRAGSVKKTRKASIQGDEKPMDSLQARALTEEDVHNWKRRLRSAKSAESLLSMATSSRNDFMPYHKRSLSSDASTIIHHHPHHLPPQHSSSRDGHTDSRLESTSSPPSSNRSKTGERRSEPPRKQSFVRGDSTRKALHRRTPSAPNTPRMDRAATGAVVNGQHKASSQPRLDSLPASPLSDSSLLTTPTTDTSLGIDIDAAIKARLTQMAYASRSARSSDSSPRSPEKLPPGGVRKEGDGDKKELGNGVVTLQESPGSHRRHNSPPSQTKFFVSRYHDYAEILSDDEKEPKMSAPSSTSDMQDLVDKLDSKLSSTTNKFYLHNATDATETQDGNTSNSNTEMTTQAADIDATTQVSGRVVERVPASSVAIDSPPPSTQVVRRRAELIPSDSVLVADPSHGQHPGRPSEFPELVPRLPGQREAVLSPTAQIRLQQVNCHSPVNSFCPSLQDDSPMREDPRWRRSTSLDSLEAESSMCRTLRAINAQMDSAFHEKVERALQLEDEGYSRHVDSDETNSLSPLHISEDNLTPTALHETHFPATVDANTPTAPETRNEVESSQSSPGQYSVHDIPPSCPVTDIDGEMEQSAESQFQSQTSPRVNQRANVRDSASVTEPSSRENVTPNSDWNQTSAVTSTSFPVREDVPFQGDSEQIRTADSVSPSVMHTQNQHANPEPGVMSPGVVRRPSSSSCSTSSSDVGDDSDDSYEIVHHAQPADAQFAMRLSSKQRAAESLPSPSRTRSESLPDARSTGMTKSKSASLDNPGDLRQFSPDDVMWRQSPLFSSGGRVGFSSDSEATSPPQSHGRRTGSEGDYAKITNPSSRPVGTSQSYDGGREVASHSQGFHGQTGGSPHHQRSERYAHMSQMQETRPRISSQPERGEIPTSPSRRQGDFRGHSFEGSSQSSVSSQSSSSVLLVDPDVPIISGNLRGRTDTHPPSPRSYPRSPPPPTEVPNTRADAAAANLPLHLMLYHPDEFKVPAAAVGVPNAPKSPAQVHVKHDTLTEEKAVIKKSPSQKSPETPRPSARSREPAEEPTQKAWKNLLSEAESFE
ncbi:hypothetical protein BaRGS_00008926, partial [Batillaria attramentaria]